MPYFSLLDESVSATPLIVDSRLLANQNADQDSIGAINYMDQSYIHDEVKLHSPQSSLRPCRCNAILSSIPASALILRLCAHSLFFIPTRFSLILLFSLSSCATVSDFCFHQAYIFSSCFAFPGWVLQLQSRRFEEDLRYFPLELRSC